MAIKKILTKRGIRWEIDYRDPLGKRHRKRFTLKRDAEAELAKIKALLAEGRYLDIKKEAKVTFKELVDKYIEIFNHQPSFYRAKIFFIKRFLKFFGENTLLSKITYLDLETYRNKLIHTPTKANKPRTAASVNREIKCLHHIFSKAIEWGMLEQNPFSKGRPLTLKEEGRRLRYLPKEEMRRLIDACPPHLKPIVILALNTGMRRKEILSLRWDQVNFKTGYIYLEKTKTGEKREIPMNQTTYRLMYQLKMKNQLKSPYVFFQKDKMGRYVPYKEVKRSFSSACKKAGIDDFRFHDLRHTFASQLVMAGASLKVVQELLGHKDITMTLRYAHLSPDYRKAAIDLLDNFFLDGHFFKN